MTATLAAAPTGKSLWNQMPGWGIVADLTPPEIIAARSLRVIRRLIALLLVLVVVGCAALFVWAKLQSSAAQDDVATASADTAQLEHDASKYSKVTSVEAATNQIQSQVAGAMQTDVDTTHLIKAIRAALPGSMLINSFTLTLTPVATTPSTDTGAAPTAGPVIGTVTITGTGKKIDDLAAFVDRVSKVPGVVDVVPGSNQLSEGVTQFGLTMSLTTKLYSHHFDLSKTGGN